MPSGITILIDFSPYLQNETSAGMRDAAFRPLSAKRPIPVIPAVPRTLEPAEDCVSCALDLAKYFDFSRVGAYRVHVSFDKTLSGVGGHARDVYVIIGAPPKPPALNTMALRF